MAAHSPDPAPSARLLGSGRVQRWSLALFVMLLASLGLSSFCTRNPPPPPPPEVDGSSDCEGAGGLRTACPAVEAPAPAPEDDEPLVPTELCNDVPPEPRRLRAMSCPDNGEVVWVFDDDNETRRAHPWDWLLKRKPQWRAECSRGDGGPLASQWPGGLESIQSMTGSEPLAAPNPPELGHSASVALPTLRRREGRETHAVDALERLRGWMNGPNPTARLALFAFDGVPDGNVSRRAPGARVDRFRGIVDALARFISDGYGLFVVAIPERYEFLYLVAHPDSIEYARALLPQIGRQAQGWPDWQRPQAPRILLLDLAPGHDPAFRNRVATFVPRIELGRPFGSRNARTTYGRLRALSHSERGWSEETTMREGERDRRINVRDWLVAEQPESVSFEVSWQTPTPAPATADATGLRVRSPFAPPLPRVVTTLQHVLPRWPAAPPAAPAELTDPLSISTLGEENAARRVGLQRVDLLTADQCPGVAGPMRCEACGEPVLSLYTVASFQPNRLHLTMVRSQRGGEAIAAQGLGFTEEGTDNVATARWAERVRAVLATDNRLPTVVLVSPRLDMERCARGMYRALAAEGVWAGALPIVVAAEGAAIDSTRTQIFGCDDSPLRDLAEAVSAARPARFAINYHGDGQWEIDRRAGISVLLRLIERATALSIPGGGACVLARFRAQNECLAMLNRPTVRPTPPNRPDAAVR